MQRSLEERSILIVEDEPLIALDISHALEASGARITITNTLKHALLLVEHDGLSAAILDYGLGSDDSTKLCARLKERGIPFLIYTGFPDLKGPASEAPRLAKPTSNEALVGAVEMLILGRATPVGARR
jgi:DNA-binding response OmpR family regulator